MAKSTTSAASAREMYFASRKSSSVPVIRINPAACSAAWMFFEFISFINSLFSVVFFCAKCKPPSNKKKSEPRLLHQTDKDIHFCVINHMSFSVRHHAHTTTTTTAFKSQTSTKTTNFVTAEYLFVSSNSRNRRRKRLVDVSSLREVGGGSMFLSRRQIRSVIARRRATCASSSPSSSSSSSTTTPNRKYRTRAHLRLTRRIIGMSRPRSNRAETNLQRLQKL